MTKTTPRRFTRGPRKKRPKGPPAPRHSHHKLRSVWFQMRAAWPLREASAATLVRERGRVLKRLAPAPGVEEWTLAGPTNVGGRMTCLAYDPANPDRIWAGAAGGGVWKSTDVGKTWTSLWHRQLSLNVGSLAIDPRDAAVLYCGTGEANLSADSYAGVGIYQTTNGGRSWRLRASSTKAGIPTRIGVIAVDAFDSAHLRIGGVGYEEDIPGGMYVSHDRGLTWRRETFISSRNYWCHSIAFHPTKRGTIFATFTENGVRSGIWRSRDGGQTWTQLKNGLPFPASMHRTSLAIAPSNPEVMYAIAANAGSGVLGVFRSTNGGDTWRNVAGTHFATEDQMSYNNAIAIHPQDANHVICGGVDLHLTTDGGQTWRRVTRWDADRGRPNYAHADHHALAMPAARPGRIYDLNDGGIDVSEDGGLTWSNRSRGLAVTMYYDLDVAPSDARFYGGGTQDNGTEVTSTGSMDDHSEILGGDGGWMVYDPKNARHMYASYYNMNIFRWRNGPYRVVSPPAPASEKESVWMVYITMDPTNPDTVFTGSNRVWRTENDGTTWKPVSAVLDGSTITAIEVAPRNHRRVYVGTENGGFFRSRDGGNTWSANLRSATLPGRMLTRIETSPAGADLLFLTVAGIGNSHVFRSEDGGETWEDIDRGRLPDVPHQAVAIPLKSPRTVYVASDAGVFVSEDLGETWLNITRNLPHAMVVDLVVHDKDDTLTVATYGRSLWRIRTRGGRPA